MRRLHRHDWVVYAKPAFGGPLRVLRYLELVPEAAASISPEGNFLVFSAAKSGFAGQILGVLPDKPLERRWPSLGSC